MNITIGVTSDVHGKLDQYEQLANKIKQLQPDLIIDNGDLLQGSLTSYYFDYVEKKQHPILLAANKLGVDVAVYGNHEFNYDEQSRAEMRAACHFPWIACNIGDYAPHYFIKIIRGKKICVIGAVTAATPKWDECQFTEGLIFEHALTAVKKTVDYVKAVEQPDAIIVSYHGGYATCPNSGAYFAEENDENEANLLLLIPEVDFVITGHQHLCIQHERSIQLGANGRFLGYIELNIETKKTTTQLIEVATGTNYLPEVAKWLQTPIGYTTHPYTYKDLLQSRLTNNPVAQLLHAVQFANCDADISIIDLGYYEQGGFDKIITNEQLLSIFSRPNYLSVLQVSGATIYTFLEQCAATFELNVQGKIDFSFHVYPNTPVAYLYYFVGGIDYTFDLSQPIGQRVTSCQFRGKPLEKLSVLNVAMNSYLATGADFEPFRSCPQIYRSNTLLPELARQFIQNNSPLPLYRLGNLSINYLQQYKNI